MVSVCPDCTWRGRRLWLSADAERPAGAPDPAADRADADSMHWQERVIAGCVGRLARLQR
jgi:hypothetical protein